MFTIIIPTHDHQDTVQYAVQSALNQTYQNFEIFVVGDGAPARTKEIVDAIIKQDARIRYYENPKGEGHGELHRAHAIKQANGQFIAYLGDDDLWLPTHLETLRSYLENYDFVQTTQATLYNQEDWHFFSGDLNHLPIRQRILTGEYNFFGPTTVAHRLDAYFKLPHGWRPKPENMPSDIHMWRQWLSQDWVRFKSLFTVTALHLAAPYRLDMSVQERCEEMLYWLNKMSEDDFNEWVVNKRLHNWRHQLNTSIKPRFLIEIIEKHFKLGNHEVTIDLSQLLLRIEPNMPKILFLMIRSFLNLDRLNEAEEAIRYALQRFPNNLGFYNVRFDLALRQNQLDVAENTALEISKFTPGKPDPYLKLSKVKEMQGDLAGAITYIDMAIDRESDNPHIISHRERLLAINKR